MTISINISDFRTGQFGRDLALLDVLHLQQVGMAPGFAATRELRQLWRLSQSQVSRRMSAVAQLGVYRVEPQHRGYRLIDLGAQQERLERAIRRLLEVTHA